MGWAGVWRGPDSPRNLDKELGTHLRLKRADFKLAQLSFCQSARDIDGVGWTSEAEMDDRKLQAELACLKLKLGVEQALFQQHAAQVQEWESSTANARLVHLETIDKLVEDATMTYCDACFPCVHLSERDEATARVNHGRRETAKVQHPTGLNIPLAGPRSRWSRRQRCSACRPSSP